MDRRQRRHLREFLGARVRPHLGIGDEIGALAGDHHRQRREVADTGQEADDLADMAQMAHVAAFDAADHGVGLAAHHRKRGDHGGVGANHGARGIGRDAAPAGDVDIGLHIGAVARIVLGIDEIEILAGLDREAEALDPRLDHGRPPDQDRPRQLLLQHHLRGAQHALVLALGIDHANRLGLGLGEHRLHDEAGAEREALQLRGIFVEILDRPRRHAGFHRRLRHRRRDAQDQPRIERARDQRARSEALRLAAVKPAAPPRPTADRARAARSRRPRHASFPR